MIIQERRIRLGEHELLLRNAREEDAQRLLHYLKTTSAETRFLIREPDEVTMTLEDERRFIQRQNESERDVMVLAFYDGEFAGNASLMGMGPSRYRHRAGLAIALTGSVMTMPGLPKVPAAENIDVTPEGTIVGLF